MPQLVRYNLSKYYRKNIASIPKLRISAVFIKKENELKLYRNSLVILALIKSTDAAQANTLL